MTVRHVFLSAILLTHLIASPSQAAVFDDITVNPVARFTRSLAQLDRVSGLCSEIESARYDTYSLMIRRYVKIVYDGEVPYWVLSDVKTRILDQNACKSMVTESLIHYQFAYKEYVESTNPKILPPVLTESMSHYDYDSVDQTTLGVARPMKR